MDNRFRGTLPRRGDIFDPEAEVFELDHTYGARRTGGYVEVDLKPAHAVAVNAGVRADHHDLARRLAVDPRLSARWSFTRRTDLRLAWGVYHQFPSPMEYDPVSGNPELGPQRARHWIAGLTHERRELMMRVEAYHKPYRGLVLHDPRLNYTNGGSRPGLRAGPVRQARRLPADPRQRLGGVQPDEVTAAAAAPPRPGGDLRGSPLALRHHPQPDGGGEGAAGGGAQRRPHPGSTPPAVRSPP